MKKQSPLSGLKGAIFLLKRLHLRYLPQIRTVLRTLFRISCWSAAAWLIWNRVLSNFFNAGGVGLFLSLGMGSFLHVMSIIMQDLEL